MAREPLAAGRIRDALRPAARERVGRLDVHREIGSTNSELLERAAPPAGAVDLCIAERQSAGRGRRGRSWQSPPGGGICLSVAWSSARNLAGLAGLSLALGAAAAGALRARGHRDVALKWPNDLMLGAAKLGGILVETAARGDALLAVAGIGLNVAAAPALDHPVAALGPAEAGDRNGLCAALVDAWLDAIERFERHGFEDFHAAWDALDLARGRAVTVSGTGGEIDGVATGVDASGALLLDCAGRARTVHAGDVSLRVAR